MSKNKLTYDIKLEKVINEVVSIRQGYNRNNKKRHLIIHFDNGSIPDVIDSWDELFDHLKKDANLISILGEYE